MQIEEDKIGLTIDCKYNTTRNKDKPDWLAVRRNHKPD